MTCRQKAGAGGKGTTVTARLTVVPGQHYTLDVGATGAAGVGTNGGGAAGGRGGGASDLRLGTATDNRIMVAGAGGGGAAGASYIDAALVVRGSASSIEPATSLAGRVEITCTHVFGSPSLARPGAALHVEAVGFVAGERVVLSLGSSVLGILNADVSGGSNGSLVVSAASLGEHPLSAAALVRAGRVGRLPPGARGSA
jgi:Glycine rich protein